MTSNPIPGYLRLRNEHQYSYKRTQIIIVAPFMQAPN